ncbi:hypothetical protein J7L48_01190 [bacterium]|nr:hypothetical protein [bacterium]
MKKSLLLILIAFMVSIFAMDIDEVKASVENWSNNDSLIKVISYFGNQSSITDEEYGFFVKAYYYLGHNAKKKRERMSIFTKGIERADKAILQNDKNTVALYYKAAILGKYGEAKGILKSLALVKPIKKLCNKIIEIDPNYAGAYHILGVMYRKLPGFAGGDKDKSYEYLKKSTELEPTFSLHFLELADTLKAMKKKDEAIKYYNMVINDDFPKDRIEEAKDKKEAKEIIDKLSK